MNSAALKTLLETDSRYDAAVRSGANALLVELLNAPAGGATTWSDIAVDDFLAAVAGQTLTVVQEERIRTYTQARTHVPTSKAAVRTWIQAQGWSAATLTALRDLAQRQQTFAEVAGIVVDGERVGLADVREAVVQIAKSAIVMDRDPARVAARQARADLINRVGVKIRSCRGKMPAADYVAFRNSLYTIHGATQAETDSLREAAVDAKVTEVGA